MINSIIKKYFSILILLTAVIAVGGDSSDLGKKKIEIDYFFQAGCAECAHVNKNILPELEERYGGSFELYKYDTGERANFMRLVAYQDRLGVSANEPVYMVINGKYILAGYGDISARIRGIMDELVSAGNVESADIQTKREQLHYNNELLEKRAAKFTTGAIIIAGLIDGINPCVFSALVFMISLMSVSGVRGAKLLSAGTIYCLACFLTYLGIGAGIFSVIKMFAAHHYMQIMVNTLMIAILILFAFLSFMDAWKYKKSGDEKAVLLKLPESLKIRIHKIMKHGMTYRYILPGAFIAGVLVTLIESVCTGQVYVPTLVLMTQYSGVATRWFAYLLLYNFMFILPLLLVFAVAYRGIKTLELIKWNKKQLIRSKLVLGCFFILMAALLLLL